jgi:hypothetical protein
MSARTLRLFLFFLSVFTPLVLGHIAAWNKGALLLSLLFEHFPHEGLPGMYCLNGTRSGVDDSDTNDAVGPLWEVCPLGALDFVQGH